VPGGMWMPIGVSTRHEATRDERSIAPGKARDRLEADASRVPSPADMDEASGDARSGDASACHRVSCNPRCCRS
jgi:hypothetical protein